MFSSVFGSGGIGLGEADDAQRGGVEQVDAAGLDDLGALDRAVAADRDADHQLPGQTAAARLVGIVEVADALDAVDPGAQVAGVRVFLGAGGDEFALRAAWRSARERRWISAASRAIARSRSIVPGRAAVGDRVGLRRRFRHRRLLLAAGAADHARLRRRLRRRRLRAQRLRRDAGLAPAARCPAWRVARALALVVLAAALVVGLGEEVGLLRGQRASGSGSGSRPASAAPARHRPARSRGRAPACRAAAATAPGSR